MAANMTGVRLNGRTAKGVRGRDGRAPRRRMVGVALMAAMLVAMVIGGVGLHGGGRFRAATPAVRSTGAGTLQDYDYQVMQQERAFEENAPILPSDGPPFDLASGQQRFPEQNTITLPSGGGSDALPSIITAEQQRSTELNTTTLPSAEAGSVTGVAQYGTSRDDRPILGRIR